VTEVMILTQMYISVRKGVKLKKE